MGAASTAGVVMQETQLASVGSALCMSSRAGKHAAYQKEVRRNSEAMNNLTWGSSSLLLILSPELLFRIVWMLEVSRPSLKDVRNLAMTCFRMATHTHWRSYAALGHGQAFPLWEKKLNEMLEQRPWSEHGRTLPLGYSRSSSTSSSSERQVACPKSCASPGLRVAQRLGGMKPARLCVCLIAATRLLQHALNHCDWVALVDLDELILRLGLYRHGMATFVLHGLLIAKDLAPCLQGLHWLWDLASGHLKPWTINRRAGFRDAASLDGLRDWLQIHVANDSRTGFHMADFYQDGFDRDDRERFSAAVRRVAAFVVVAAEGPTASVLQAGLSSVVPFATLSEEVAKAYIGKGQPATHLQGLMLMMLSHPVLLSGLSVARQAWADLCKEPSEGEWHGILLQLQFQYLEDGRVHVEDQAWRVDALHFPKLCFEKGGWLHSQHGNAHRLSHLPHVQPDRAFVSSRKVQFDARVSDSQAETFIGDWMDCTDTRQMRSVMMYSVWEHPHVLSRWLSIADLQVPQSDSLVAGPYPCSSCKFVFASNAANSGICKVCRHARPAHSVPYPQELLGVMGMGEVKGAASDGTMRMLQCAHLVRCGTRLK